MQKSYLFFIIAYKIKYFGDVTGMKKTISIALSILMIMLCFSGCSGTKMTEENVKKTVDKAFTALCEFDTKNLRKYVDSKTLSTIIGYAEKQEQFQSLGKAIFSGLEYEIKSVDLENQTVTVNVKNKSLYQTAYEFARELKSNYSTFQLLTKLSDETFLNTYLTELCNDIENAPSASESVDITLGITQGKKNLVLSFDSTSEDTVSGGALSAIKYIYGIN